MRIAVAAILIAGMPSIAGAAKISPGTGDVRVRVGEGFQKILAPADFAPGTQVVVGPGATATIAYTASCVIHVKPGSVAEVQEGSPCSRLPAPSALGATSIAAAHDASEPLVQTIAEEKKTSGQLSQTSRPPRKKRSDDHDIWGSYCLIPGVAVSAGVLAAVLLSQHHETPASP